MSLYLAIYITGFIIGCIAIGYTMDDYGEVMDQTCLCALVLWPICLLFLCCFLVVFAAFMLPIGIGMLLADWTRETR